MRMIQFRAVIVLLLSSFTVAVSSQELSPPAILDPSDEQSSKLLESFPTAVIQAELNRRQALVSRKARSMTADEVDSLILQKLLVGIQTQPKLSKAILDLSDVQMSAVEAILQDITLEAVGRSKRGIDAMCNRWIGSRLNRQSRLEDSLAAFDEGFELDAEAEGLAVADALAQLEPILGLANWGKFEEYMNIERERTAHSVVYTFSENLRMVENPEATINYHCGDR